MFVGIDHKERKIDRLCKHLWFFCSREFSHRVKSISLAKFTAGEVQALQEGGNEVRIYKRPQAIRILGGFPVLGLFMFLKISQVPTVVGEGEILWQKTSEISLGYATVLCCAIY